MTNNTPFRESTRRAASFASTKISEEHLQRAAVLYVRQSTSTQLREHQESTARQYALRDRLIAFGWADDRVIVIDEDLGISGSGNTERVGFRRLLKLVTDQQVGMVLGLEMSRLARNSKDWHDLFEVSAIFNTHDDVLRTVSVTWQFARVVSSLGSAPHQAPFPQRQT